MTPPPAQAAPSGAKAPVGAAGAAVAVAEKPCPFLINYDRQSPSLKELKDQLENGTPEVKAAAMRRVILMHINGEPMPQLLMTIIRFALPVNDKPLKKLLYLYWEIIEKKGVDGKPLPEFLLVCNYFRNDLNSPNEFVRGSCLRFLCKLKEPSLFEPLVPSIKVNLEHRHSYVRRWAVLCVYSIFKMAERLIPDAPELVERFLSSESDPSAKRNAFIMLFQCSQERAISYLKSIADQVSSAGDSFQLILLDMLRKLCRTATPSDKGKYMRIILALLSSKSPSVLFQCAGVLVGLSSAPAAIKAAAQCYSQLLTTHSDNNVKLIVLDRLIELKQRHPKVLSELLMDILRALNSPSMDIRRKVLNEIAMDLVTARNIDDVINFLKKEIIKTQTSDFEKNHEYRQVLVQAIHTCAIRFPEVAAHNVLHLLMDFLAYSNAAASAVDVILFVREIVEMYPEVSESVLQKLIQVFPQITSPRVYRCALWILGNYSRSPAEISASFSSIKSVLGDLSFAAEAAAASADAPSSSSSSAPAEAPKPSAPVVKTSTRVLADGTYATQTIISEAASSSADPSSPSNASAASRNSLRGLILGGDFFLASVVCATMTRLSLRLRQIAPDNSAVIASLMSDASAAITALLGLGESSLPTHRIDPDSFERMSSCLSLLTFNDEVARTAFIRDSRSVFSSMLSEKQQQKKLADAAAKSSGSGKALSLLDSSGVGVVVESQADRLISFSQLKGQRTYDGLDWELEADGAEGGDVARATGNSGRNAADDSFASRLNRITQLTGFSDPVYAEACVTVHQFDVLLDVLLVNQTNDTLQNLTLELATVGDLKLCERPQNYTLGPFASLAIKANIKVSSTETGIIFGNIVYDAAAAAGSDRACIILNDIHIDIMDYISPASCSDSQFRTMWAEFEWENKVAVNTEITDLNAFMQHIMSSTNMRCLTPPSSLAGECDFLSANLYAKSSFGEDALANVSIEKAANGRITGFIRIRSKTQGIALSLGDKITNKSKN